MPSGYPVGGKVQIVLATLHPYYIKMWDISDFEIRTLVLDVHSCYSPSAVYEYYDLNYKQMGRDVLAFG